jgi:predicted GNAT superfamily acetyltransferase
VILRDITDLAGCRAVVALQEQVWGQGSEIVPASVLLVSAKRGGILIGAFEGTELAGFVWSMPGVRDGQPTHWSHMLGVLPGARRHGLGRRLKLAQRDRAVAQGIDLIEWTFDPLQAPNAHLNFTVLGCVASTYLADVYGGMSGPLHRGTATDRLIAEWKIRAPHVERRVAALANRPAFIVRTHEIATAPKAIATSPSGEWIAAAGTALTLSERRIMVPVPARFTEMQERDLPLARQWRTATRDVFTTYFAQGYRAVDFFLDEDGGGKYLLEKSTDNERRASE